MWLLGSHACVLFLLPRTQAVETGRIIGGTPVPNGTYPFHGLSPPGVLCGCSLIHPNVAVSAGHCKGLFVGYSIYLGGILPDRSDAVDVIEIVEERVHPHYDRFSLDNDFLVLRLGRPSTITTFLEWNEDAIEPKSGDSLTAIGFGVTEYRGPRAETLLRVNVPAISRDDCAAAYGATDNMLCAGGEEYRDACTGDSGSPILDEDGVMVGIVSSGPSGGCGLKGKPGIYARASAGDLFFKQAVCDWSTGDVDTPEYCKDITPFPTNSPTSRAPVPAPPTLNPTVTPPFNDDCTTARYLGGLSYDGGTTHNANSDTVALCGRNVDTTSALPGVWFRVVGSGSIMSISMCEVANSQLFIFEGGCDSLQCLRGTSNGCDGEPGALIKWSSVYAREYWILAQTASPTDFTLTTSRFLIGPRNFACFLPQSIGLGDTVSGTTLGGGPAPFSGSCGEIEANSIGVWYIIQGIADTVTADTCSSGVEIDTHIAVFHGEDCSSLECVAGANGGCGNALSSVTWVAEPTKVYRIFVHGEVGDFVLRLRGDKTDEPSTAPSPLPDSLLYEPTVGPEETLGPEPTVGPEETATPSAEPTSEPKPTVGPETTLGLEPSMRPEAALQPEPTVEPQEPLESAPSEGPSPEPTMGPETTPVLAPSLQPEAVVQPEVPVSPTLPVPEVEQSCSLICLLSNFIRSLFG